MARLSDSLNVASHALFAQQSAMQTSGHNIANAQTEGFSRQKVELDAEAPAHDGTGGGVKRGIIGRVFDRFTQQKITQENSKSSAFGTREKFLEKLEIVFNEIDGAGLRHQLDEFWNSWSALSNQPESDAAREKVVEQTQALSAHFRRMHGEISTLRQEANGRIKGIVAEMNQIAGQISNLNQQIKVSERAGQPANDARDERMLLLEKLSEFVDVNWFENDRGAIVATIGDRWTFIEATRFNPLQARMLDGEVGMFQVEGKGENEMTHNLTHSFNSGELKETFEVRDHVLINYTNKLDELAFGLAHHVNRLHTTGTGLNSAHESLKSSFGLQEDARHQPLPFLKDGILQIHLVDPNNDFLETYELEIQSGVDTVDSIVSRINETVQDPSVLEAVVEEDGAVTIHAKNGNRFIFGEDETEFTMLMGFNNLFETLKGARDLRINDRIAKHPHQLSTGKDLIPGDNQVALAIAELQINPTMTEETITFDEFYNGILAEVGLSIQRNQSDKQHQDLVLNQFRDIRNSMSSVNVDEEMADMVQYQRGYEASAKFLSVVDEMTSTIIQM